MKNIVELEAERLKWSLNTFSEATPLSSLKKLRTEIDEIEYDIQNGERRVEPQSIVVDVLPNSVNVIFQY